MIWSCNCLGIINPSHRPPTTAAPLQNESACPRRCYASCRLSLFCGWLSRILLTWLTRPWQLSPIMTMAIVNTIVPVGVSSSDRITLMTCEWKRLRTPTIFSLFSWGRAKKVLVKAACSAVGDSLGFSLGFWCRRHPTQFKLIEDQDHICNAIQHLLLRL